MSQISALYEYYTESAGVETDSRKDLTDKIFFALKGENFDGNKFAQAAIDSGAALAVIDDPDYSSEKTYLVDDVLDSLQQLGLYHRRTLGIPIIAITGSNGKTTTKEIMHTVLSQKYKCSATLGNLNNHIGIPLTLLSIPEDAEIAIVEMGANHKKEIESYCKYTEPNYGLITNCGKAHLEGFGSIEGVREGKGELFVYLRENDGFAFVNQDLDYLLEMSEGIDQKTYGKNGAEFSGELLDSINGNLALEVAGLKITTHLTGNYNFDNVMAALCVGDYFSIDIESMSEAVENYMPDNSRSQVIEKNNNTIILDAYNANPTSMALAIQNLKSIPGKNKVALLGGMKELGKDSLSEHQKIVDLLRDNSIDQAFLVGVDFKNTENGSYLYMDNAEAVGDYLQEHPIIEPSVILIKGSRATQMEKILNIL